MKGIVFTEFLDFVEERHGADLVDDVIEAAALPHGGAYTAVGTYPHAEMQDLVAALAQRTGASASDLLGAFGRHLCRRFALTNPGFFAEQTCLFGFLASVDAHIHVEVHKLYPDAELPSFTARARGPGTLEMDYRSCRPLEALAEGMIRAAAEHYCEPVSVSRDRVAVADGEVVRFTISQAA